MSNKLRLTTLLLTLLTLTSLAVGQFTSYNAYQSTTFANAGTGSVLAERQAIKYHQIYWTVAGSLSACSVVVDSSPDGTTWTGGGIIGAQTCTTSGNSALTTSVAANFIRVNVVSLTGTGTVNVKYYGYTYNPNPGGAGGSGTVTNIATSAPLGGGPITNTGTLTCTTCLTGSAAAAGTPYFGSAGQAVTNDTLITHNGTGGLAFSAGATHILSTQGTLTTLGTPFLSHSVTFNGGTQLFVDDSRAITCTAAAANTSAYQVTVGGNTIFNMQFNAANCATPMFDVASAANVHVRLRAAAGVQVASGLGYGVNSGVNLGVGAIDTGWDRAAAGTLRADANAGLSDGLGKYQAAAYLTTANCASSTGVCAAASSGSVAIAAAATTVTVATTAVTASSNIFVTEDSSLGTKLGVTCNTTTGRLYVVTARTAATSFVITSSAAPTTNPACLNYWIVN